MSGLGGGAGMAGGMGAGGWSALRQDPRLLYASLGMLSGSQRTTGQTDPFGGALRGLSMGQQAMLQQSMIDMRKEQIERKRREEEKKRQAQHMMPGLMKAYMDPQTPDARAQAQAGIMGLYPSQAPSMLSAAAGRQTTLEAANIAAQSRRDVANISTEAAASRPTTTVGKLNQAVLDGEISPTQYEKEIKNRYDPSYADEIIRLARKKADGTATDKDKEMWNYLKIVDPYDRMLSREMGL